VHNQPGMHGHPCMRKLHAWIRRHQRLL